MNSISFTVAALVAFTPSIVAAEIQPADPAKIKMELLLKYDRNKDGRLDAEERETMRLALKEKRLGKPESFFKIPQDFLAKYDSNKNGEMDPDEWKTAWDAETKILRDNYDTDKDGTLNQKEKAAMMADVKKGKITGIPAFFAGRMNGEGEGSKATYLIEQEKLLQFDLDHDGRASAAELSRIRASTSKTR